MRSSGGGGGSGGGSGAARAGDVGAGAGHVGLGDAVGRLLAVVAVRGFNKCSKRTLMVLMAKGELATIEKGIGTQYSMPKEQENGGREATEENASKTNGASHGGDRIPREIPKQFRRRMRRICEFVSRPSAL